MKLNREVLYERITRLWHDWAEDHGQVPVWPPRHGSQTHHMALIAVSVTATVVQDLETEVLEDVATFLRAQKRKNPKAAAVLEKMSTALEDGSWEEM